MAGNIIDQNNNGDENLVRVGDSNSQVSLKTYQDIYHQVTGRTEQIRKRTSSNLLIDFDEIEQLHFKITQLCQVHNIVAKNEIVTIFHEKERKEQFTSFERFRAYNSNASSPTLSLVLKYNFSIMLAELARPQEYVINIRLNSRIGLENSMDDEYPAFIRGRLLRYSNEPTAEITIDYTDYVIARGFLEAFDEWLNGCKSTPVNKLLEWFQSRSHFIPQICKLSAILLVSLFALFSIPKFFNHDSNTEIWARFSVIYFTGSIVLSNLMFQVGNMLEITIDRYPILSYLKLNKGDIKLIDESGKNKNAVIYRFLIGCALNIILGIIATKLEVFV